MLLSLIRSVNLNLIKFIGTSFARMISHLSHSLLLNCALEQSKFYSFPDSSLAWCEGCKDPTDFILWNAVVVLSLFLFSLYLVIAQSHTPSQPLPDYCWWPLPCFLQWPPTLFHRWCPTKRLRDGDRRLYPYACYQISFGTWCPQKCTQTCNTYFHFPLTSHHQITLLSSWSSCFTSIGIDPSAFRK